MEGIAGVEAAKAEVKDEKPHRSFYRKTIRNLRLRILETVLDFSYGFNYRKTGRCAVVRDFPKDKEV